MRLHDLYILHLPKSRVTDPDAIIACSSSKVLFQLETCQRWIWVSSIDPSAFAHTKMSIEGYQGQDAYLFLLRLACGLESEILGETDIFGQVKEAWRKFEASKSPAVQSLGPWMRKIFEDTKEIRSRYLQNLGGNSYGTLVRKMMKDQGAQKGPTFLVGAGQIAHSIAPFLMDSDLWIWNRTAATASAFSKSLSQRARPSQKNSEVLVLEDEAKGWAEAAHIVVCTPFHSQLDEKRFTWLSQRSQDYSSVIHLGGMREHSGIWNSIRRFYCLTDLFDLQNSMKNVRSVQISQAIKACEERAKLRASVIPVSVCCQAWEDVALLQ